MDMMTAARKTSVTRETLDHFWRTRVEKAQDRYHKATGHYRLLLSDHADGNSPDPNGPVALARQVESEALAEYCRVLRTFTELMVNGKIPDEGTEETSV